MAQTGQPCLEMTLVGNGLTVHVTFHFKIQQQKNCNFIQTGTVQSPNESYLEGLHLCSQIPLL